MTVNKNKKIFLKWLLPGVIIAVLILSASGSSVVYYALGFVGNVQEAISASISSIFNSDDDHRDGDESDPGLPLDEGVMSPGDLYCYSQLNDNEKKVYEKISSAVENHKESVHNLRIKDSEVLFKILNYVGIDHPEYFWWETRGSVGIGTLMGYVVDVSITFDYAISETEVEEYKQKIDKAIDSFISSVDINADEYEKVLMVYDYIIDNVDYNKSAPNNQNIVSALIGNESVCTGYSKSMQYLLNKLGVFSTNVIGEAKDIGAHTWNLVAIEGEYYYIDATWGDPFFKNNELVVDNKNYDYFCVTSEEIKKTHAFTDIVIWPECTARECNYYVKNGLYLNAYVRTEIERLILTAVENEEEVASMKLATPEIYEKADFDLFANQKAFQMIRKAERSTGKKLISDKISYTKNDDLNIIKINLEYL